jgi:hypothetical protein
MIADGLEEEPNDTPASAQHVPFPIIINGRIDQPGDRDHFRFEAYGSLVAEVYARRFGSPVDSAIKLTDPAGVELASNDDYEDKGLPMLTHHADSRILTTLPGQGVYCLRIADVQRKGGRDFTYRLHIRRPRPDFELRIVPSSIVAAPGSNVLVNVHALRREGFDEDIYLGLHEPPPGFKLSGAWVPSGQDVVPLTLTVPAKEAEEPIALEMEGRSSGRTRTITRVAVPAEHMMQAFLYQHLVPTKDWTVFVSRRSRSGRNPQMNYEGHQPAQLMVGEGTPLRIASKGRLPLGSIRLELVEPPEGITIEKVTPKSGALAVTIAADAQTVEAGLKGNLVFRAYRETTPPATDGRAAKPRRSLMGLLPAVPFEVTSTRKTRR